MRGSKNETFYGVVTAFESYLERDKRTRDEVTAELTRALKEVDRLAVHLPNIDDVENAEVRARLASLKASLNRTATDYLTGQAPVISYVTTTQTTTMDIAKEQYLDPERSTEIERLNAIVDPLNIPAGTELKIYAR